MPRLWARIIKNQRIEQQMTAFCTLDETEETLTEICRAFDIPRPLWLNKHCREFGEFRRTRFLPEHFMESVPFDRMEVEFIDPDKKKKNPNPYAPLL